MGVGVHEVEPEVKAGNKKKWRNIKQFYKPTDQHINLYKCVDASKNVKSSAIKIKLERG